MLPVYVYLNTVETSRSLFVGSGRRLCSLATNEVPSFAMNSNAAILTVTLPVSRKTVRYYPRTGRIEERRCRKQMPQPRWIPTTVERWGKVKRLKASRPGQVIG